MSADYLRDETSFCKVEKNGVIIGKMPDEKGVSLLKAVEMSYVKSWIGLVVLLGVGTLGGSHSSADGIGELHRKRDWHDRKKHDQLRESERLRIAIDEPMRSWNKGLRIIQRTDNVFLVIIKLFRCYRGRCVIDSI